MAQLVIVLMTGWLAPNGTLEEVGYTRQEFPPRTAVTIDRDKEIQGYECLVGVPYNLRNTVGREVYFLTEKEVYGPWLVTDVEAKHHAPYMLQAGLIDISCKKYAHLKGQLAIAERRD